jgi:FAD/FMN-containing dehydrogenase
VTLAAAAGVAIVPQGGNTGLAGGSIPNDSANSVLLSVLKRVQEAADGADRLFPLSLTAEGSCQIGGNLSTNAGGISVLRYGSMRDLVLGLEVVLPDGRVWDGLRALRKDNSGYDLKQLFIGAEGTLGVITAAVLKLFPRPRKRVTAFAAASSMEAALALLARFRDASADALTSFEVIPRVALERAITTVPGSFDPFVRPHDPYLLIELAVSAMDIDLQGICEKALALALEEGLLIDATIAASETQANRLWFLREAVVEAQASAGASIKHDIAVPVSAVPAFLREASAMVESAVPSVVVYAFGHLGDGNIHFNLLQPPSMQAADFLAKTAELNRLVHDVVARFAGSISAEHGLGQLRRDEIRRYRPAVELDLMARVKAALDPAGIMNPGKLLPTSD